MTINVMNANAFPYFVGLSSSDVIASLGANKLEVPGSYIDAAAAGWEGNYSGFVNIHVPLLGHDLLEYLTRFAAAASKLPIKASVWGLDDIRKKSFDEYINLENN